MAKAQKNERPRNPKSTAIPSTPAKGSGQIDPSALSEITPTSPTFASLQSLSQVLYLLHHRSKNQHRRSTWYKHFNTFRRTLSSLLRELSPAPPPTWLPSRKRKLVEEKMRKAEVRVGFVRDVLVARWWVAFVQLVGDRQFAAVGLVLVAALGSFCTSLGLEWEDESDVLDGVDAEAVLEHFAADAGVDGGEGDDVGVVVERQEGGEGEDWSGSEGRGSEDNPLTDEEQQPKRGPAKRAKRRSDASPEPKKKKAKKRKKGDAIDDLFAGLL